MSDISPNSVVDALVITKSSAATAIGRLHALHHYWEKLNHHERALSLESAKHELERALVAVMVAEREIAPTAKSEPSNVVQTGSEYQRNLDTVAEIVGAPQFDGAA